MTARDSEYFKAEIMGWPNGPEPYIQTLTVLAESDFDALYRVKQYYDGQLGPKGWRLVKISKVNK